jgi:hypothetical protein
MIRQSSSRGTRFIGPHKNLTSGQYKSKLAIGAKMMRSLIDTGMGYYLGTSE